MTEPTSIGSCLRAARRKRRLSIERVAEDTRIRSDFLMRMESDEFDFLAPAYVRGFLRSYASFLRIDPDPLVDEFDRRFGSARADASQIVALDRRSSKVPRQRRKTNSWGIAAALAASVLLALGAVGLAQGPPDEPPGDDTASTRSETPAEEPTPTEEAEPVETVSPSPSPSPSETALAFADGIDLEIDAGRADCWVLVTADGTEVFSGTIPVGEAESFTADNSMTVVLGNASGIDLIVNGQNIGSPGGTVKTIELPDDVKGAL
ncbi:MAG: DUF4115 domain-containing protein [Actinobacteria bacterium]|nr:DUF4115 domain-containing protein [Actinomycetota bacterium]